MLVLALLLPLLGFITLLFWKGEKGAPFIGCATILASFLIFLSFFATGAPHQSVTLFPWIHVGPVNADFTLVLDHLSLLMALIITGIGFLIHLYSVGYVEHEEGIVRYFACMNFFVFAMLLLVLAGDLLVLFIGWEGVGLASYLLIGFYFTRPKAAQAAKKAFVINRIGDLGLLLGLLLTYKLFGTSDIETIVQQVGGEGTFIVTVLALLYFIGAVGKSAQLPLYTWLPDAMEGPTPVSALIHAATMVTAGVYLVVRMHALFNLSPIALQVVGVIGGVTSLFAALCALGQTDLKRVLAFSTVSQLGLMFLACGIGAYYSAMFHLTTHAFVKALLFLSAGNVVHGLNGTTEMEKMGGLSKIFTKTHWLFAIGALALAGIPPFATFFSKDLILEEEYEMGYHTLFWVALAASLLTGVYLTRAYTLTFRGQLPQGLEAKEAPTIMLVPVAILALLSIVGGFFGYELLRFIQGIGVTPLEEELSQGFHPSWEMFLAAGGAVAAVIASFWFYSRYHKNPPPLLKNAFYIDDLYWKGIALPLQKGADRVSKDLEPTWIEGSLKSLILAVGKVAEGLQNGQSGQIRSYVAWMALGAALFLIYLVGEA